MYVDSTFIMFYAHMHEARTIKRWVSISSVCCGRTWLAWPQPCPTALGWTWKPTVRQTWSANISVGPHWCSEREQIPAARFKHLVETLKPDEWRPLKQLFPRKAASVELSQIEFSFFWFNISGVGIIVVSQTWKLYMFVAKCRNEQALPVSFTLNSNNNRKSFYVELFCEIMKNLNAV